MVASVDTTMVELICSFDKLRVPSDAPRVETVERCVFCSVAVNNKYIQLRMIGMSFLYKRKAVYPKGQHNELGRKPNQNVNVCNVHIRPPDDPRVVLSEREDVARSYYLWM